MSLVIPDYDIKTEHTKCVLFKMYNNECSTYVYNLDISKQIDNFINVDSTLAVVHGTGFFIFMVGLQSGFFTNVSELIVIDGWFPNNGQFDHINYSTELPKCKTVYIFTCEQLKSSHILKNIVKEHVINYQINNIKIMEAIGFKTNLVFQSSSKKYVDVLIRYAQTLYDSKEFVNRITVAKLDAILKLNGKQ